MNYMEYQKGTIEHERRHGEGAGLVFSERLTTECVFEQRLEESNRRFLERDYE